MRHDLLSHLNEKICRVSQFRANELVDKGEAEWTSDGVQLFPPKEYCEDQRNYRTAGSMNEAWPFRESDGFVMRQLDTPKDKAIVNQTS